MFLHYILWSGLHRCGKSCRLRWINYLRPDLKRGNFDEDEEDLIIKLHALLGNRWSLIAGRLPGRTDNEVKNYWNSHLRRKLINMGIDPNNHRLVTLRPKSPHISTSTSVTSSATKILPKHNHHPSVKSRICNDYLVFDESRSSLEHEPVLPDLNLDLTIKVSTPMVEEGKKQEFIFPSSTLHLFR